MKFAWKLFGKLNDTRQTTWFSNAVARDFCTELVASLQSWLDLLVCRSVRARDVGCSENAYNKSLLYSGTEVLSKPKTGWPG